MNNIETEIRSFITKQQYEALINYFTTNATKIKEDNQETIYFDCKEDIRIQKNDFFAKIWMKKWEIHDDHREETEIKSDKADFETLQQVFTALGIKTQIKRLRQRTEFQRNDITVCLDYSKGYGYIIELEKMTNEADKQQEYEKLKQQLIDLQIAITPKEIFKEKYEYYKQNWKTLLAE